MGDPKLETSSYTVSGSGTFTVRINKPGSGAQDGVTTWINQPAEVSHPHFPQNMTMAGGGFYSLSTGSCPVGLRIIPISSPDSSFSWFQDYKPCPIGSYVIH